jgi:hypothetical protein
MRVYPEIRLGDPAPLRLRMWHVTQLNMLRGKINLPPRGTWIHRFLLHSDMPVDPLSITTSALALLGVCRSIVNFFAALKPDGTVDAIRADIQSLEGDVEILYNDRNASQSLAIQPNQNRVKIGQRIEAELDGCRKTLQDLQDFLYPLQPNLRSALILQFNAEKVQGLRARIAKHQQTLQFYMILVVKY